MMPGHERRVLVSLAGEPLLTVAVRVGVSHKQREDGLAEAKRMMVWTLAKGGDIRWLPPEEFIARLASGIAEGAGQAGGTHDAAPPAARDGQSALK
jgi:hypothetical protein